jgi:hypothetical protein
MGNFPPRAIRTGIKSSFTQRATISSPAQVDQKIRELRGKICSSRENPYGEHGNPHRSWYKGVKGRTLTA